MGSSGQHLAEIAEGTEPGDRDMIEADGMEDGYFEASRSGGAMSHQLVIAIFPLESVLIYAYHIYNYPQLPHLLISPVFFTTTPY